jgi:alpha-1,2-mannosyltransferase
LLLLKPHPWAAGLVLGLLSYKPHLAVLVPVALIAGRNWQALAGAVISAGLLALASVLVLGGAVWLAFLRTIPAAGKMLYQGIEGSMPPWNQMASVFSAAHLAGLKPGAAFTLQGLVMAGSLGLVLWVWFRGPSLPIRASIVILAALLFPPYSYAYDLTILALPLAWLGWQGYTRGWLPGEQAILFLGWWAPLFISYHLNIIPPVLIMLILLALRRMRHEEKSKQLPE